MSVAALLELPAAPVCVDDTPPDWLVNTPEGATTTRIEIAHVPPAAAMAPPVRASVVEPAVVPVTAPPQELVKVGVASTLMPGGNVSLNATAVMPAVQVFVAGAGCAA